jgi:hypothetical protein
MSLHRRIDKDKHHRRKNGGGGCWGLQPPNILEGTGLLPLLSNPGLLQYRLTVSHNYVAQIYST